MEFVRAAGQDIDPLNIYLIVFATHSLGSVAHIYLCKQHLYCIDAVLMCLYLEGLGQSLLLFLLDKAHEVFEVSHLEDLAVRSRI